MQPAYAILDFLWALLPLVVVVVVLVLGVLFLVRNEDGQRALTALCLRVLDFFLPKREPAQQRAADRAAKANGHPY